MTMRRRSKQRPFKKNNSKFQHSLNEKLLWKMVTLLRMSWCFVFWFWLFLCFPLPSSTCSEFRNNRKIESHIFGIWKRKIDLDFNWNCKWSLKIMKRRSHWLSCLKMGKENLRGFGRLTNSWNHGWCSLNQKRTSIYIYGTSNWCSDHSKLWHKLLHVPKFMTHDSPKCWNQEIKQRTFIIIIISRLVLDSYLVTILGGKMSATAPPKTLLFLVIIIIIVIVIAIVIVIIIIYIPDSRFSSIDNLCDELNWTVQPQDVWESPISAQC